MVEHNTCNKNENSESILSNKCTNKQISQFINTDNGRILNIDKIRWIKHIDDCYAICQKSSGCSLSNWDELHKVCKYNKSSYKTVTRLINNKKIQL